MSKNANRTVTLIGVGIILVAVAIVTGAMLMPRVMAKNALKKQLNALREAEEIAYLSVLDPTRNAGPLFPEELEARLTDAGEIDAVRERLLAVLDGARYAGEENAASGNWDLRIRFDAEGDPMDFYLREDDVYLTKGSVRLVFAVGDTVAYTALRDELIALLPAGEN